MKPFLLLVLAAAAVSLGGCASMYVGGSVGTSVGNLSPGGYHPRFLPASQGTGKAGYVCGKTDCAAASTERTS